MTNIVAPFFNDLLLFLFIFVFVALASKLFHFSAEKHLFLDLSTINDDLPTQHFENFGIFCVKKLAKLRHWLENVDKVASLAYKRRQSSVVGL